MIPDKNKVASIIKLSQNENAFGASPLALKAIAEHYPSIYRYPELIPKALTSKLTQKYKCMPDNIVMAGGSVELIDLIFKAFVGIDENFVTAQITFVAYFLLAKVHRRECRRAELVDYTLDINNIIALCDKKTKVVFVANPNNPTGTIISHDALHTLLQTLPRDILVVIDEAYAEYVTDTVYPDSFELQKTFPNLIILRTFSKIYGLAGLRIGYAIAHPERIQSLHQHRTPFSVNRLSVIAASAALDDTEFIQECALLNEKERNFLYHELKNMGLNTVPSHGNFIFVDCGTAEERLRIQSSLKNDGILVRDLTLFGAETGLRISVGRPEENQYLVKSLRKMSLL